MKKLILDENFDNVDVDVQAVSSPSFVQANKEHDEDKKEFEDAIKENEKLAKETIPEEGSTGKKVTSPALKKMHLSEELFTEASNSGLRGKVREFVIDTIYEALDNLVMVVNSKFPEYDPDWFDDDVDREVQTVGRQVRALANVIVNGLFKDAINESINPSNRDEFSRRMWSFLYDMMTDFDASYDDIYQEVRNFCDEGPLIDFDESLNESVNEEDLEIRLINYIKKFQKHYNIDAASMSKVLAAVGKSIELLNPVNESLKEDLNAETFEKVKEVAYELEKFLTSKSVSCGELINYEDSVMNCGIIKFEVDGDWKHDHLYFDDMVEKFFDDNSQWSLLGRPYEENIEDNGSDWYTATHVIRICPKDKIEDMLAMSKLFGESLKEDLDEGDYGDLKSDVYNALADVVFKYQWKGISQAEVEKAIEWFEIKFFEDEFEEGLKESLEYQIAREQIKRFNEGKMSKNWNPETYLENLVKNNHITEAEATRLTESLLSESDDKFELQAWCCDGNNFARYREPMYWRKVGVYDTEEEAKNFVDKARKVSRQHEGDGSVQIIKYGSRWNSCVWNDIVRH